MRQHHRNRHQEGLSHEQTHEVSEAPRPGGAGGSDIPLPVGGRPQQSQGQTEGRSGDAEDQNRPVYFQGFQGRRVVSF